MTVASPYAVFRAADLGWPPPITARNPQIGASVRNNPLATTVRRSQQLRAVQGQLFAEP